VWAGRVYTVIYAAATMLPLLRREGPNWAGAVGLALSAGGLLYATERMRRGSRVAACTLLGLFVVGRLADWFVSGVPVWNGLLWTVLIGGALATGTSGTFALAAVRRDALLVPPAPPRPSHGRAAI
jgi:hypothetical protein